MIHTFGVVLGAIVAALAAAPDAATAEAKPTNIVLIVADDLGWRDLGCFGSSFYETPAIDALAESGVVFPNGYASCPVCSPTRASIYTGKYPARLDLTAHIGAPQPWQWRKSTPLNPAKYIDHLPLEEITIAETLHDAGYATFFAGKWHLGMQDRYWPEYYGFDVNLGGWTQGGPFGGKQYFSPYGNPRLPDGPPGEHLCDRLATEAARFIESHKHKPFFVCLPFYSVHVPLVAREDLLKKYQLKQAEVRRSENEVFGRDCGRKVRIVQDLPVYAAMVEAMDQAIGKVLAAVEKQGLSDRTIVIFTSDNGGLSTGDDGIAADQGWPTSNMPLRMGKGWLYEGGVRVPLVVRVPGRQRVSRSDRVVTSTDFYPTILELAGRPAMPEQHRDGVSFAAALAGDATPREPVYWHYPHYSNQGGKPGAAVRDGDWKLIHWFDDDRVELFNLDVDLGETKNLAAAEPRRAAAMKSKLDRWRTEVHASMPTKNE